MRARPDWVCEVVSESNANVDTAHEMVSMLATVRHFDALLRMEQGDDEMLGQAIRKLGEA